MTIEKFFDFISKYEYKILRGKDNLNKISKHNNEDIDIFINYDSNLSELLKKDFNCIFRSSSQIISFDRAHIFIWIFDHKKNFNYSFDCLNEFYFDYKIFFKIKNLKIAYSSCQEVNYFINFLHEVFDKKCTRVEKLKEIERKLFDNWIVIKQCLINNKVDLKIIDLIEKNIENSKDIRWCKILKYSYFIKNKDILKQLIITYYDRIKLRRICRKYIFVSLYGPDGMGKTTLAKYVVQNIKPPRTKVSYKYFGNSNKYIFLQRFFKLLILMKNLFKYNYFKSNFYDIKRLSSAEYKNILLKLFKIKNKFQGPFLNHIVILDRGIFDDLIYIKDKRLINTFIKNHKIEENLIVFLRDEANNVYKRKREKSINEIEEVLKKQYEIYNLLKNQYICTKEYFSFQDENINKNKFADFIYKSLKGKL